MIDIRQGDCLDVMREIPDASVDMVLCDLPYGTTACAWDAVLPMDVLWREYERVLCPLGAVVMFGSQPFSTTLIQSKLDWFKYEWIWLKNRPTNFAHAKNKPMKKHENILVFSPGTTVHASQSRRRMTYNPQGVRRLDRAERRGTQATDVHFQARASHGEYEAEFTGFPHSILEFSTDMLKLHPTAKPVALCEYLIRTYTNEGQVVLDNCMGSGTTGVACLNTGRSFIGIEKDPHYFEVSRKRLAETEAEINATRAPFASMFV